MRAITRPRRATRAAAFTLVLLARTAYHVEAQLGSFLQPVPVLLQFPQTLNPFVQGLDINLVCRGIPKTPPPAAAASDLDLGSEWRASVQVTDQAAVGTQLGATVAVTDPSACAAHCLELPEEAVSMNVCKDGATLRCQCSGWGVEYDLQQNRTGCAWYRRSIPRDERRALPKVAVRAEVPQGGVALSPASLLSKARRNPSTSTHATIRHPRVR
jgi:hypothetical protein